MGVRESTPHLCGAGLARPGETATSLSPCWISRSGSPESIDQEGARVEEFLETSSAAWLAANLAYVKDLDYAETRIAQLSGTKGRGSQQESGANAEAEEEPEKPFKPRRRRPKNSDASA